MNQITRCALVAGLVVIAGLGWGADVTAPAPEGKKLEQGGSGDGLRDHMFHDMMVVREAHSERISSWDRSGGNKDFISVGPGKTATLAEIEGAGCVRRFYCGLMAVDRLAMRQLVLRAWWDGEDSPSIEVPLGDFFGVVPGAAHRFQSLMVSVSPGSDRTDIDGMVSWFPMPFAKGARITIENQGPTLVPAMWYHVDFERYGSLPDDVGRFHAQWRRQNPTPADDVDPARRNLHLASGSNKTGKGNYTLLEAEGRGNFVGFFLHIDNPHQGWYGEGDDMIFVDGEAWPPTYHGTGTEEIFNGGACPDVEYSGPFSGFHFVERGDWRGGVSMYRFHVADPIRFNKSIRVTIEHGHANNFENDYASTAFWYQTGAHSPYPPLPPVAERAPHMSPEFAEAMELERKILMEYMVVFGPDFDAKGPDFTPRAERMKMDLAAAFRKPDYALAKETLEKMRALIGEAKLAARK